MIREKLEKLDAHLDRLSLERRLRVEGEHLKRIKCSKILRIYIKPSEDTIRIYTRILGDFKAEESMSVWDVIRRVAVSVGTALPTVDDAPAGQAADARGFHIATADMPTDMFEWTKEASTEAFLVHRKPAHSNYQLLLKLVNPRRMVKLSSRLSSLFGKYADTKQNIIKDFYRYINKNRLSEYSTSVVSCDDTLRELFRTDQFNFNGIGHMVDFITEPLGYCVVNINTQEGEIWDIEIECDDLSQMPNLYPKIVQEMDQKIEANREIERRLEERLEVIGQFMDNPYYFINRKIALESDCPGMQTGFYDDLTVQSTLYELIKKHDK